MIIFYTYIEEEKHQYLLNKYINICPDEFKMKILKYRRWQDAQLSLLGRVLLEYGLNNYFDIKKFEIGYTPNKKPFLVNQKLHFNISHAGNLVVCMIANCIIGIDIEYINSKTNYIDFKSQMTESEFNRIYNSEDKFRSFFTYWTEKEAIIKAHGKGLLIPLQSFEVFHNQSVIENKKFYLKEIFIDEEYQCYVASTEDIREQEIHIEQLNMNQI